MMMVLRTQKQHCTNNWLSLIYLTTTRLDLAYVVSHWVAAKGVLRYLQGTLDFGIIYTNSFDVRMTGFLNSDWAENLVD